MKTLQLNDGHSIPQLGLGTWQSKPGEVGNAVALALKAGYRHIDCAWIYGNEAEIGQALGQAIDSGVVRRDELFVTSKLWNDAHGESLFQKRLDQTLAALGLDYVDLYLIHWPVAFVDGVSLAKTREQYMTPEERPLAATWAMMEAAQAADKVRSIGVSNFSAQHIDEILAGAQIKPVMNQVECHPYFSQRPLVESCKAHGIHLTAYSPLGSADPQGKRAARGIPSVIADPAIAGIAADVNVTPAQVLIAWAMERGTVVIPKSTDPERIRQNLAAAEICLSPEHMASIDALERGLRYIDGAFFCGDNSPYSLEGLWGK